MALQPTGQRRTLEPGRFENPAADSPPRSNSYLISRPCSFDVRTRPPAPMATGANGTTLEPMLQGKSEPLVKVATDRIMTTMKLFQGRSSQSLSTSQQTSQLMGRTNSQPDQIEARYVRSIRLSIRWKGLQGRRSGSKNQFSPN